jgi:hypothetical protein
MKTRSLIILLMLIVLAFSCKNDNDDNPALPQELTLVRDGLITSLDSLNTMIEDAVIQFAASEIDTIQMRAKLLELFNSSSFVNEFSYIDTLGILQIIEPEAYHSYQGEDISTQPHVISAFQTFQPVLSDVFLVMEGYHACVDIHPIVHTTQLLGAISAVFAPAELLGRIIMPVVKDQDFEIWVMEKTGVVLFDQDTAEIGLNVLTDPLYAAYPELITACNKMIAEESGETRYSFFQTGTSTTVSKKTFWNTFALYGNEWKIVWVKPE